MGWESFNLHPRLIKAMNKAGFIKPTDIQERALIYTNFTVDIIIASKTVTAII